MDISELIEQVKNKDEYAAEKLVNLTRKRLYYTALKLVNNSATAEDIVQETYISAFQHLDQLQDPDKLDGWLAKIASNKAKTYLEKKSGKDIKFSELDNIDDGLNFEESVEDKTEFFRPEENFNYEEVRNGLNALLNELPAQTRMALILFYHDKLKIREIADIQGVTDGTIKALLASGRNKIKDRIEQMRKKGTSFYGFAPMSVFSWVLNTEMTSTAAPYVNVSKIAALSRMPAIPASGSMVIKAGVQSAGASKAAATAGTSGTAAVGTSTKATVSAGTAIKTAVSVKVVTIATAVVVTTGAGVMIYNQSDFSFFDNRNEPQETETISENETIVVEEDIVRDWKTAYREDLSNYANEFGYTYFNLIDINKDGIPEIYCENENGGSMIIVYSEDRERGDELFGQHLTENHDLYVRYNGNNIETLNDRTWERIIYEIDDGEINVVHIAEVYPDQTAYADPNQWEWDGVRMTVDEWLALYDQYFPEPAEVLSITKPVVINHLTVYFTDRGTGVSYDRMMELIEDY